MSAGGTLKYNISSHLAAVIAVLEVVSCVMQKCPVHHLFLHCGRAVKQYCPLDPTTSGGSMWHSTLSVV